MRSLGCLYKSVYGLPDDFGGSEVFAGGEVLEEGFLIVGADVMDA